MPAILQSALHPMGPQAASIDGLWWLMFWTCTAVYVLVLAAVVAGVQRARNDQRLPPREPQMQRAVIAASAVTVFILIGLLFASVATGRAIGAPPSQTPVVISITGYQWWWAIEYHNPDPSLRVTTANELHIPTGRPIVLQLTSGDVIHSFWVPNLHGKMDLIPGRQNTLSLQADTPGVYRGQCAEFCGLQHANMAFSVVAEPSDDFEHWLTAQRQPAPPPGAEAQQRGRQVVEHGPCVMCHTVRGTNAGGRMGPDLTHFATRSTIGAGTLPNRRDLLAQWIRDPQHFKPGTRMPTLGLSDADLEAVLAYLETLR
jgi:cytochrome c oxidase subunit II